METRKKDKCANIPTPPTPVAAPESKIQWITSLDSAPKVVPGIAIFVAFAQITTSIDPGNKGRDIRPKEQQTETEIALLRDARLGM